MTVPSPTPRLHALTTKYSILTTTTIPSTSLSLPFLTRINPLCKGLNKGSEKALQCFCNYTIQKEKYGKVFFGMGKVKLS